MFVALTTECVSTKDGLTMLNQINVHAYLARANLG